LPARILCTALVVWIFIFPVTYVSAQDESSIQTLELQTTDPIEDPIRAAEQSLTLGGGDAGTAIPGSSVSAFGIFRMLVTLAVVAAAIYGLVYFP